MAVGGNSQEIPEPVRGLQREKGGNGETGLGGWGVCATLHRTVRGGLSEKLTLAQPMRSIWGDVSGEMASAKAPGPRACRAAGTAG